jgi:hypothetical protein
VIYDAHPKILTEKVEATLAGLKTETPQPPTEDELQKIINQLLFQLIFAGKKIKRQELWVAVSTINQQVSHLLLQLIEFHTVTVVKESQGIRYEGRFLEQRISPTIVDRLPLSFAKYDILDAIRTIAQLLNISRSLVKEICETQNYACNADQFDKTQKLFDDMFAKEER